MININEVYEIVQNMAQKAQHGSISVSEFNKYANMASMDLFNEKIGPVRDYYQLGKAMAKTSPSMNKVVDQSLRPFLVYDLPVLVTAGLANIPTDCEFIDNIMFDNVDLKWIPKSKIGSYLNSTIDNPTEEYPVYIDSKDGIQVYPNTIELVDLTYYKTPVTVEWKYTLVANKPVFTSTGSVNFEWYPTQKLQLVTRILGYIGISIRDTELTQYAEQQENTIA